MGDEERQEFLAWYESQKSEDFSTTGVCLKNIARKRSRS